MLEHESLTERVIGLAIGVHRELGPGLLESTYELCLFDELSRAGLTTQRQLSLPVVFRERVIESGYRIDLLVRSVLLIELKSVERILPIHEAQLLTYMRLAGVPVGLLINFNVPVLKDGVLRRVLTRPSPRPPRTPR